MYVQYVSKGYFSLVKWIWKIIENIFFSKNVDIYITTKKEKKKTKKKNHYKSTAICRFLYYQPYSSDVNCQSCVKPFLYVWTWNQK